MFSAHKNLSENLIIFVLALFIFASVLGVGMSIEMRDGQMSGCPFMASQATLCQMSLAEHIGQWQQMFLGIPTKTNLLALVMLLLVVTVFSFIKAFSQFEKLTEPSTRLRTYQKSHFAKIFDPLLLAFSDGVLNPKIYEPAHI